MVKKLSQSFLQMFDLSLSTANGLYGLANALTVAGALLAFVGAFGIFWTGSVRDRYGDQQKKQLESSTAVAVAEAARANESNTRLQLELEKERAERLRLETKIAPRTISADQHESLVNAFKLTGWSKAVVIWHGTGEPESYARDFGRAFEAAGIETSVHTLGPFLPSAWGLGLVQSDPPNATNRLHEILAGVRISSEIYGTNDTLGTADYPRIVVGSRADTAL